MHSRIQMALMGVLAVAMLAAVGCQGNGDGQPGSRADRLASVQPVEILDRTAGSAGEAIQHPGWKLVKTQEELDELGLELDREVDFDKYDLVVQSLGQRNTGGYWVHIKSVEREGNVLWVRSVVNRPGEGQPTTQQITYPYGAVLIRDTPATRLRTSTESVTGQAPPSAGN
mgnify:CR=1 FL=1